MVIFYILPAASIADIVKSLKTLLNNLLGGLSSIVDFFRNFGSWISGIGNHILMVVNVIGGTFTAFNQLNLFSQGIILIFLQVIAMITLVRVVIDLL